MEEMVMISLERYNKLIEKLHTAEDIIAKDTEKENRLRNYCIEENKFAGKVVSDAFLGTAHIEDIVDIFGWNIDKFVADVKKYAQKYWEEISNE